MHKTISNQCLRVLRLMNISHHFLYSILSPMKNITFFVVVSTSISALRLQLRVCSCRPLQVVELFIRSESFITVSVFYDAWCSGAGYSMMRDDDDVTDIKYRGSRAILRYLNFKELPAASNNRINRSRNTC